MMGMGMVMVEVVMDIDTWQGMSGTLCVGGRPVGDGAEFGARAGVAVGRGRVPEGGQFRGVARVFSTLPVRAGATQETGTATTASASSHVSPRSTTAKKTFFHSLGHWY